MLGKRAAHIKTLEGIRWKSFCQLFDHFAYIRYNAIARWYSLHWKIIFNLYSNVLSFLSKKNYRQALLKQLNCCMYNENEYSCKRATSSCTRVLFSKCLDTIINTTISMIRESSYNIVLRKVSSYESDMSDYKCHIRTEVLIHFWMQSLT